MQINLPKPLHGWRAFAGEVGIIVIGVLIALGAQQVVESIHQREDIAQLRGAFRAELADDRARWEDIRAQDRCTLQRLDAIQRWVANAPAGARLEKSFRLMLWNMHSSAWDIAKTSPATAHIPLDEQLAYADLYAAIDNWRGYFAQESDNSVELSALVASADQAENRRQIMLHIAKERLFVRRRVQNYPYFFTRFDALKIRPDASRLTIARDPQALCQPLAN
jgi:hypothetical protein